MLHNVTLSGLAKAIVSEVDLLICATSFESRSVSVATALEHHPIGHVVAFSDPGAGALGEATAARLDQLFSDRVLHCSLQLRDPLQVANTMIDALAQRVVGCNLIVVDVTTFTHESLLILVKILQIVVGGGTRVVGVYNSADDYALGLPPEQKWLTKGLLDVRSVLGYAGENVPTQPQHLIVLAGFEAERAELIIDAFEPTLLTIGLGDRNHSVSMGFYDINRWFHQRLLSKYPRVRQFSFSCTDAEMTRDAVLLQARSVPNYNVVVAPLNTKISTIGVAKASFVEPSLQICYGVPEQYNKEGYSVPGKTAYMFELL